MLVSAPAAITDQRPLHTFFLSLATLKPFNSKQRKFVLRYGLRSFPTASTIALTEAAFSEEAGTLRKAPLADTIFADLLSLGGHFLGKCSFA